MRRPLMEGFQVSSALQASAMSSQGAGCAGGQGAWEGSPGAGMETGAATEGRSAALMGTCVCPSPPPKSRCLLTSSLARLGLGFCTEQVLSPTSPVPTLQCRDQVSVLLAGPGTSLSATDKPSAALLALHRCRAPLCSKMHTAL